MENIIIGNHTFQYKICHDETEWGGYEWTDFYYGTYTNTYRKYLLFGPVMTSEKPKLAFKVDIDISSRALTNDEVKRWVMKAYEHWCGLQIRDQLLSEGKFM